MHTWPRFRGGITPHHGFLRYRGHSHREALDVLSFWKLGFSLDSCFVLLLVSLAFFIFQGYS